MGNDIKLDAERKRSPAEPRFCRKLSHELNAQFWCLLASHSSPAISAWQAENPKLLERPNELNA